MVWLSNKHCCGIEGAASDIGTSMTSSLSVVKPELTCMRSGGHLGDVEQIGMGMVIKSSNELESKSCMGPGGCCGGDEWMG